MISIFDLFNGNIHNYIKFVLVLTPVLNFYLYSYAAPILGGPPRGQDRY